MYFDKDGKVVHYNLGKPINSGTFGNIYRINSSKCFKEICTWDGIPDRDAFNKIAEMKLNNFCRIYKILYSSLGYINGYVMKYYESEEMDLLTMPTEYIIDNFIDMWKSVLKLSKNRIRIRDLHTGNVILNDYGMTIIDMDRYLSDESSDIDTLIRMNKETLYELFSDLFRNSLISYYMDDLYDIEYLLYDLFDVEDEYNQVCKRLLRYKYPYDYLYYRGK